VYVTAVPYNQFDIPDEKLTGNGGTTTLSFRRLANFPASRSGKWGRAYDGRDPPNGRKAGDHRHPPTPWSSRAGGS
jgi:hypothetical protein